MMKTGLIHLFLLTTFITATGCVGIQDRMQKRAVQKRASIAYSEVESTCGQRRGPHYEDGWIAGYTDVANGSEGKKRPFAPSKYHGPRFQTETGRQFVMNWHEGYEMGTHYALATNADACHTIPILGNASLPESEPVIPAWYFANEQVVRPDYEIEELAPPEMKREDAFDTDDESDEKVETESDAAEGVDENDGNEQQTDVQGGNARNNGRRKEISPSDIIVEPAQKSRRTPGSPMPKANNSDDNELNPPNQERKILPKPDALPDSRLPEIGKYNSGQHRPIKPAQFKRTDWNGKTAIFASPTRNIGSSDPGVPENPTATVPTTTHATAALLSTVVKRRISDQGSRESQPQSERVVFQFNRDKQPQPDKSAAVPVKKTIQLKKLERPVANPPHQGNSPAAQPVRRTSLEATIEPASDQTEVKQPGIEQSTATANDVDQNTHPKPVRSSVSDRRSSRRVRTAK